MVEVFKTNVTDQEEAEKLISLIRHRFKGYDANFDLDDCDKILRVCCKTAGIQSGLIIGLLVEAGFAAEILEEDIQISESTVLIH
ncbi:hypothetical protein [Dyadobacter sp. LHD-138]|uniref:hypothetical protein n=1 Tax=Dyadobacter sp. LHD-138 TaxID=3071413 RepID=UPI0027E09CD7|nr:hypothetical protein [Dyadobacter sp. LHD-138]MDQ6477533.1 hypothetical protein [Dyadobacter sp. LHD-138]